MSTTHRCPHGLLTWMQLTLTPRALIAKGRNATDCCWHLPERVIAQQLCCHMHVSCCCWTATLVVKQHSNFIAQALRKAMRLLSEEPRVWIRYVLMVARERGLKQNFFRRRRRWTEWPAAASPVKVNESFTPNPRVREDHEVMDKTLITSHLESD